MGAFLVPVLGLIVVLVLVALVVKRRSRREIDRSDRLQGPGVTRESAMAAVGIILLLIIVTGNWRNLLLILVNVPFALVGGVRGRY